MKLKHALTIIYVVLSLSCFGCNRTTSAGKPNTNEPTAASANASSNSNHEPAPATDKNSNAGADAASATTKPSEPPQLVGTYEAREVEDKGVVTIISQAKTIIVFTADGHYSRAAQNNGRVYHKDSGTFTIEAPDKLVLSIQISDKDIKSPPVTKTHRFSLSADGNELKLISDKGSTATFQRTAAPKTS